MRKDWIIELQVKLAVITMHIMVENAANINRKTLVFNVLVEMERKGRIWNVTDMILKSFDIRKIFVK